MEFHGAKAPHDFQPCVGSLTVGKRQGFLAVGPRDRMENYTGLWPRAISRPLPGPEEPKTLMLGACIPRFSVVRRIFRFPFKILKAKRSLVTEKFVPYSC